jgi:hypothetical protein
MKRQFRQADGELTSEQDELLRWKRAHWDEAQIQSRPTRGYVTPSDAEKARLVWQEAQIPKSKPLTDPQAEKLGKALRLAVEWYQRAGEQRPAREKEQLAKIKRTAEKLVRLLASSSETRVRLKREFPGWSIDRRVLGSVSVIRKAAVRAQVYTDNTTGEKVSRRRGGAVLEEKFGSPGRLFIQRVAVHYEKVTGKQPGLPSTLTKERSRGRSFDSPRSRRGDSTYRCRTARRSKRP